jgi:hypothetical protein
MKGIALLSFLTVIAATPANAVCTSDVFGRISCTTEQERMYQEALPSGMRSAPVGSYATPNDLSSRPNPSGGYNYSNGVYSRPNPSGGYDYSNGVRCRPNPLGGMDCR